MIWIGGRPIQVAEVSDAGKNDKAGQTQPEADKDRPAKNRHPSLFRVALEDRVDAEAGETYTEPTENDESENRGYWCSLKFHPLDAHRARATILVCLHEQAPAGTSLKLPNLSLTPPQATAHRSYHLEHRQRTTPGIPMP
jgi:hypothetical protein